MRTDSNTTTRALPEDLRTRLAEFLGQESIRTTPAHRLVYATDGMSLTPHFPLAVLYPSSFEQVAPIVRLLHEEGIPFVPRGAGTGLSGGAVPMGGSVVLNMARLRRIHTIDPERRLAIVEPGVVNAELSRRTAPFGLEFAPDPSSQFACTIGGNVAENAGGPHTLKQGITRAHVLALETVRPEGTLRVLPGGGERLEEILPFPPEDLPGADFVSLETGSEGTLSVVTRIACRLIPVAPAHATVAAYFADCEEAVASVTDLLASGFLPAAMEMMDEVALAPVAEAFSLSIPEKARAFLIVEVDGFEEEVEAEARCVEETFQKRNALEARRARSEEERETLWFARKKALGTLGRISPSYYVHDGVVPRSRLGEALREIGKLSEAHGLRVANLFHAGDGNLHPIILFDAKDPDESRRTKSLGEEILKLCVALGGTLTGEHGIGWEKRHLMAHLFTETQMGLMARIRDHFNPRGLLNPEKAIPLPVGCLEGGRALRPTDLERDTLRAGTPQRVTLRPSAPRFEAEVLPKIAVTTRRTSPSAELVRARCAAVLDSQESVRIVDGIPELHLSRPVAQIWAADEGSVGRVLDLALREGWRVLPKGGGTQLSHGGPLPGVDLVLDLSSLCTIHRIAAGDLVVEVGAGITLQRLNDALAGDALWVPLDAPDPLRSTMGGLLATAHSGFRAGRWGSSRFRVLALESCSPGLGRQLWGRGVAKNVAGYDVGRLMVGSMGTLGVFTRVTLRADPCPRRWRTAIVSGPVATLTKLAGDLLRSFHPWSHIELLAAAATQARPKQRWWPEGDGLVLLVGCDGTEEVSHRLENELHHLLGNGGSGRGVTLQWQSTKDVAPDLHSWVYEFSETSSGESQRVILRCHTDPLAAPEAVAKAVEQLHGKPARLQLHARTGILRVAWNETEPERLATPSDMLPVQGGWIVLETAPRPHSRAFLRAGSPSPDADLLGEMKGILDPSGLLRPVSALPVRRLSG